MKRISKDNELKLSSSIDAILAELTTPQNSDISTAKINGVVAGITTNVKTLYLKAYGSADVNEKEELSVDHVMSFFSCTKALTCTAILQLHETGRLDINANAANYLPQIGKIGLIDEGLVSDEDGSFTEEPREPQNPVTIKHLLTHTAGFAYAFTSIDYFYLLTKKEPQLTAVDPAPEYFSQEKLPLLFEPGSKWLYGHNTDWLGLIIEEITGMKLGDYLHENLFKKIGMTSCTFHADHSKPYLKVHKRTGKFGVVVNKGRSVNSDPKVDMGGHGCFGTVGDYLKFMRVWINKGVSPDTGVRILEEDTITYAILNHLPPGYSVDFETVTSALLEDGGNDGFTLSGCAFTAENLPTGRPKGTIYWSGLANLYFWMDIENGIAGFWGSQFFPYMDKYSIGGYLRMEEATYQALGNDLKL